MKYIRIVLGAIIIFFDAITRRRPIKRSEEEQKVIDEKTKKLSLYQFHTCPFCVKVRREIHRLNLKVKLRDAKNEIVADELITGGGKRKVPCLRIEEETKTLWMYESKDIIAYLQESFEPKK